MDKNALYMTAAHKKIILALSFALIVILGAYYFGVYKGRPISYQKGDASGLIAKNSGGDNFLQGDADKDGLKYWEEALWKTDPNNPDTDGDGTSDGQETKEGRDPNVAGPDDKLKSMANFGETGTDTSSQSKTESSLTDAIARNLYTNYSVLKQSGELTPENQAKINEALGASVEQIIRPKLYVANDLNITTGETPASIKKYGNDVASAINDNLTTTTQNEAVNLLNYLDKKDPAGLKKVADSAESYKKAVSAILSVTVPPSAIDVHLSLVNGVNFFGRAILGMAQIDADPVVAMASLNNYQQGAEKIVVAFRGLISYFADKKIIFTEADAGYIFTKGI